MPLRSPLCHHVAANAVLSLRFLPGSTPTRPPKGDVNVLFVSSVALSTHYPTLPFRGTSKYLVELESSRFDHLFRRARFYSNGWGLRRWWQHEPRANSIRHLFPVGDHARPIFRVNDSDHQCDELRGLGQPLRRGHMQRDIDRYTGCDRNLFLHRDGYWSWW